jgi:NADP-dependent 3-hydroxy acid dehydrogenase YdfG
LSGALVSQVAIVTGAGRGIGRAVARALAAEGAAVVLAARTRAELATTASEIRDAGGRALALPTDVTSERGVVGLVDETLATFERVDILVNAAGSATFGPVAEGKVDDWDAMIAVNLRAVMLACRAVLPAMTRQGRGTIVNVASIAARRAIPGTAVYAATKAGVVAFSHALAEELRPRVRVGVIVPGAVDTPLWDSIPEGPERQRMLTADDVARCVVTMATLRDGAWVEDLTLMPAGGIL